VRPIPARGTLPFYGELGGRPLPPPGGKGRRVAGSVAPAANIVLVGLAGSSGCPAHSPFP
jgi:hypothetical protein